MSRIITAMLAAFICFSAQPATAATTKPAVLGPSRGIVIKLAALFCVDSFAGGFVVHSLLALWLFERFDLSLAQASVRADAWPAANWWVGLGDPQLDRLIDE